MPSENRSVHWWCHYAIKERSTAHVISVHIMTSRNWLWHLATDHDISGHIMVVCKLRSTHIINAEPINLSSNISYFHQLVSSMPNPLNCQVTYHVFNNLGSHHAIWESISPLMMPLRYQGTFHGSCHQCAHHDISQHIMTSRNRSWHLATDHDISQHIMSSHDTSWLFMMSSHPWNRMVYHTDIGHRCKEMTFNLYRVVYDVSPMEPDGLSHGHWTQMQGDDF